MLNNQVLKVNLDMIADKCGEKLKRTWIMGSLVLLNAPFNAKQGTLFCNMLVDHHFPS